jgi:hypothetical protein
VNPVVDIPHDVTHETDSANFWHIDKGKSQNSLRLDSLAVHAREREPTGNCVGAFAGYGFLPSGYATIASWGEIVGESNARGEPGAQCTAKSNPLGNAKALFIIHLPALPAVVFWHRGLSQAASETAQPIVLL